MSYINSERTQIDVTLQDQKFAEDAIAWVMSWESTGRKLSDYEWNVLAAIKVGVATGRTANLLASVIPSYRRHLEKAAEAAALLPSAHVGTVGERLILTFKIIRVIPHNSDFGTTYIHGFRDEAGNDFVWFGSNQLESLDGKLSEVGDTVTVKGTIKGHNEYKGRKQTALSRVALYTPPAPKIRKPRVKKVKAPVAEESVSELPVQ